MLNRKTKYTNTHSATMRQYFQQSLIIFLLTCFATTSAHATELIIGTKGTYLPFHQVDENGKLSRFELDLMDKRCHRIQANCTYKSASGMD